LGTISFYEVGADFSAMFSRRIQILNFGRGEHAFNFTYWLRASFSDSVLTKYQARWMSHTTIVEDFACLAYRARFAMGES
jgi:hypothetical protein